MDDLKFPYKILIADGGDNYELESHLGEHKNYPNLNYDYIKYPFDSTLEDYYKKLNDVLTRVKTKYVLHADNDDFYIFDNIKNHLDFLNQNSDYVCSRGSLVNLELIGRSYEPISTPKGYAFITRYVVSESISSASHLERIRQLCEGMSKFDYYANWYSITRTETLVEIWGKLVLLRIKEVIVLEILSHIMLVTAGKIRITPDEFYFRQSHTSSFGDTLVQDNGFLERCLANNGLSEFNYAFSNFQILKGADEKSIVLKNVAYWLNEFIFNINSNRSDNLRHTISRFFRTTRQSRRIIFLIARVKTNKTTSMKSSEKLISKYIISNLENQEFFNV